MATKPSKLRETTPGALKHAIETVTREEGAKLQGDLSRYCTKGACAFYATAYRQYEGMLRTVGEVQTCLRLAQKLCPDIGVSPETGKIDKVRFKAAILGAYRMAVEAERIILS
jgi:hypothetical protein